MSNHENTAPEQDVYRRVTDSIITAIENGGGPISDALDCPPGQGV